MSTSSKSSTVPLGFSCLIWLDAWATAAGASASALALDFFGVAFLGVDPLLLLFDFLSTPLAGATLELMLEVAVPGIAMASAYFFLATRTRSRAPAGVEEPARLA